MDLGTFSVSLSVKNIEVSIEFYQALGFKIIDGGHMHVGFEDSDTDKWRILEKDDVHIGLFQGVFEGNILTFNPPNVREIQRVLKEHNIALEQEADDDGEGAANITVRDPDGNLLLFDQF